MKDETEMWTSQRGTLIPSEAANWCEWINHLQLAIQNTYVWANGRTPPAWGEKLMCWWAASQIYAGQIQDCGLLHYLPVSHCHLVCFSVYFCPPQSVSPSLSRSAESWLRVCQMKRKQNAFWSSSHVLQLCQRALPPQKSARKVSKPNIQTFNVHTINAQAQRLDKWLNRNAAE